MFAYPGRKDAIKSGGHVDELLDTFAFALDRVRGGTAAAGALQLRLPHPQHHRGHRGDLRQGSRACRRRWAWFARCPS